jgi:hypothetical protein
VSRVSPLKLPGTPPGPADWGRRSRSRMERQLSRTMWLSTSTSRAGRDPEPEPSRPAVELRPYASGPARRRCRSGAAAADGAASFWCDVLSWGIKSRSSLGSTTCPPWFIRSPGALGPHRSV